MLLDYSRVDAISVAPHYGLDFPEDAKAPNEKLVDLATRILTSVAPDVFPEAAVAVGSALWSGNQSELENSAEQYGSMDAAKAKSLVQAGSKRRDQLKHYSGAMLYYAGEWYWGPDRLYHLEKRLIELGARKPGKTKLLIPRPEIDCGKLKDGGRLTLEFYPSLRSPYSSFIYDRVIQLVKDSGVKLVLRPVIPMVMRGVSLSRQKGMYILFDAWREAKTLGLDWGKVYDPIGRPTMRAFSLFPWAREQRKSIEFISAFMKAAWFEGVNTNKERGLQYVVEKAGLSWQDAQSVIDNTDWEEEMEDNRLAMYSFGCWGVPSFRLFDENDEVVLAAWGQDRTWLVAREIKRLLEQRSK